MTDSVTTEQVARTVHERKAVDKIRTAATLLGEAGSHLGKAQDKPQQRWYDCNKLYHGAIAWLERWEYP